MEEPAGNGALVLGALALIALLAMFAATVTWMSGPWQIVYYESSLHPTAEHSVEVKEHGRSHYLTPVQKKRLDDMRRRVPVVWFSCFAYLFFYLGCGGLEALTRHELFRRPPEDTR